MPPHGPGKCACTLAPCQSPVKYGTTMNSTNGTISSTAQAYVNHTASRRPKMLNTQTKMIRPIAMTDDSLRGLPAKENETPQLGHHCEVARSPMILPKIDNTTDQPIQ